MKELVFLLEELSAKAMLESLLPRFVNKDIGFRCIPFEGKRDLEKGLMRKIRAYPNNQARFIILRDQDSIPECRDIKQNLLDLCTKAGKAHLCLVRIACKELETFYLADLNAVEEALGIEGIAKKQQKANFRAPDNIISPSRELKKLTDGNYQKVSGSREIGKYLDLNNDRSLSFKNLIAGIKRMENELLNEP